jgi:hypothetical protein
MKMNVAANSKFLNSLKNISNHLREDYSMMSQVTNTFANLNLEKIQVTSSSPESSNLQQVLP